MSPPRLPPLLRAELEGLDWTLERGSKHWHLRIAGTLIAVLPGGPMQDTDRRNALSVRSRIRHWRKDHQHERHA